MYLPPISIVEEPIKYQMDDGILKAVQKVGIHVDRDELLKALQYDRQQYEAGYREGYAQAVQEYTYINHNEHEMGEQKW